MLVKICMVIQIAACFSHCRFHCWNTATNASLCSHPLVCLHQCSASVNKCQWVQFFLEWKTTPLLHLHFHNRCDCQTAPLLPSVTQQLHVMEYWQEGSTSTAILPTSAWCCGRTSKSEELLLEHSSYLVASLFPFGSWKLLQISLLLLCKSQLKACWARLAQEL